MSSAQAMPPTYEQIAVGDRLPALTKPPITTRQLAQYAGASGDFNRIHYDEPFAKAGGFPSVIAHGMLSMAFFGQLLTDWLGSPTPIRRLAARFKAITYPGDVITCTGEVTAKQELDGRRLIELSLAAHNQAGKLTLEGTATIQLIPGGNP